MDLAFLESLLGRIHARYSVAYRDLADKLLKCGLSDEQVLEVVAAIQPMIEAKQDHVVVSLAWSSTQFERNADAELSSAVDEVVGRYAS